MTSDVEFTNNMCMLSSTHTRKLNVLFWDFEEEFYWDVTFHLLTYRLITGCITHPRSDMWQFGTSIPMSSSYQFACFYYFVPNSCGGKDAYHPHDLWGSQSASHSFYINSSLILFCLTFSLLKIHLWQGETISVGSLRKSIPSFLQAFYSHTHIAKVCFASVSSSCHGILIWNNYDLILSSPLQILCHCCLFTMGGGFTTFLYSSSSCFRIKHLSFPFSTTCLWWWSSLERGKPP